MASGALMARQQSWSCSSHTSKGSSVSGCLPAPLPAAARMALISSNSSSSSRSLRQVSAAAAASDASSEQIRPDTCNSNDQDRPGPLSDLDEEWQEFISGRGRYTQPQPLMWDADSSLPGNWPPTTSTCSSSSDSDGGSIGSSSSGSNPASGTSNRGPEASCSGRYSSSIQSFDDWDALEGDYAMPVPCNMPVNEALPMGTSSANASSNPASAAAAAAAASIHSLAGADSSLWASALQPARDLVSPADVLGGRGLWQNMREVYVLLFGVGQKDTEGIYSLRAVSEDGLPTETIIAFENMDDAVRYAALLEATMEHSPHVCSIPPAELMAFCSDSGYRCRLELEGSLLMPPEYNVHVTDWERSLRLREGKFHVLQEEPDLTAADMLGLGFSLPAGLGSMAGYSLSRDSPFNNSEEQASEFAVGELDLLKAQLEALLPASSLDGDDEAVQDS